MNIGLLLAAGKSERFKKDKLFVSLNGRSVIYYSLKFLQDSPRVDAVFIAANRGNRRKIEKLAGKENFTKVKKIFLGGKTRYESVEKGLRQIGKKTKAGHLIIHNAANPFVRESELMECLKLCAKGFSGAAPGRKIHATIKEMNSDSLKSTAISRTVPRKNLFEVQTPQVVKTEDFFAARKKIKSPKPDCTDDLTVLEAAGYKTAIARASAGNIKLTIPEDLELMDCLAGGLPEDFRVGIGEDSHAAKIQPPKNKYQKYLKLGGVVFKDCSAPEADSDGDAVLHALCNAIAGALGKGSLGTYATVMCKRGVEDSKKYLEFILAKMRAQKFRIHQCSLSISAKNPRIDPAAHLLKNSLSVLLNIPAGNIGITATSGQGTAVFERGGIKCSAAVILKKSNGG